jgi:hypothetical protein
MDKNEIFYHDVPEIHGIEILIIYISFISILISLPIVWIIVNN